MLRMINQLKKLFSATSTWRWVFSATAFVAVIFLVAPAPVYAFLGLEDLLAGILLSIAEFFGRLTVTLIGILVSIAQYNTFVDAPAVVKGWVIVRDVCNMFFIVILLLIAFGSVFRIEEYQYKKILGKLLIMAVLINFSKSISGFFIDISQVVMLTFVNGFKEAAAGNFVNGFQIAEMFSFAEKNDPAGGSSSTYLAAASLALITILISMIVVMIYVVVFILRIVALWFLIIISPIAYALAAFPGDAKKYSSQWWDYFGKYATTGPILAFFLWLSLAVMQFSTSSLGDFKAGVIDTTKDTGGFGTDIPAAAVTGIGQSDVLLSFIVNIILLVGGLWMTQQLGVAGGKLAGTAMNKIQGAGAKIARAPFKAVAAPVGFAAKRAWGSTKLSYSKLTGKLMEGTKMADGSIKESGKVKKTIWAALNAPAAARGWEARTKEMEHEQKEISDAYGREVTEQFRTGGKLKVPYAAFVERKHENEYMREYQNMSKEQFMQSATGLEHMEGTEGERRKRALVKAAASQGYMDDLMRMPQFANKYAIGNEVNNEKTLHRFLYGFLGTSRETMRMLDQDMDALAKATNHPEYMGHAQYNAKTGAYENTMEEVTDDKGNVVDMKDKGMMEYSHGEWKKLGGRPRTMTAPHAEVSQIADKYDKDMIGADGKMHKKGEFVVTADGTVDVHWGIAEKGRTDFQKGMSQILSDQGVIGEKKHTQARVPNILLSENYDDMTGDMIVNSKQDLERIEKLFDEMPARMLAMYQLKSKKDGAKGFVVRVISSDGTEKMRKAFGAADQGNDPMIGNEVASSLKEKELGINGKDKVKQGQIVSKVTNKISAGEYNSIEQIEKGIKKDDEKAYEDAFKPEKPKEPTDRNSPNYSKEMAEYTAKLAEYANQVTNLDASIRNLAAKIVNTFGQKIAEFSDFEKDIKDAPKNSEGISEPADLKTDEIATLQKNIRDFLKEAFNKSIEKKHEISSPEMKSYMYQSLGNQIDELIKNKEEFRTKVSGEGESRNLLRPQVIKRIVNSFLPSKIDKPTIKE